jgi:signal peptidase II
MNAASDLSTITAPKTVSGHDRAWRDARSIVTFVFVAAALLTVDLVTKAVAFERVAGYPVTLERNEAGHVIQVPPHEPIIVIPKILGLHLTANEGAVFGLGRGARWMLVGFSMLAVGIVSYVFSRSDRRSRVLHITLAAVLAGALGNLYDRVIYGVVRDMCWLFPRVKLPFGWHWPDGSDGLYPWIFNIADVCLVGSLIVLMVIMWRHDRAVARATR